MVIDPNAGGVGRNRLSTGQSEGAKAPERSKGGEAANAPATPRDSVSLSGAGKAMSRLEASVQSSPDVDQQKVAAIKTAIANGSYSPNPSAIADKMLSDF